MTSKEFVQLISKAKITNELTIDSINEFQQNQDVFWSEIFKLTKLKRIQLINQHILSIPPEIGTLNELEELSIVDTASSENEEGISSIPENLFLLPCLIRLEIVGQNISQIPLGIKNLKKLETLILGNALWLDRNREVQNIIGKTRVFKLPKEFFELVNLRVIDISGVGLSEIPRQIGLLKNLISFTVRANNIVDIPREIKLLKSLKHLDLRDNPVNILPEILGKVKNPKAFYRRFLLKGDHSINSNSCLSVRVLLARRRLLVK